MEKYYLKCILLIIVSLLPISPSANAAKTAAKKPSKKSKQISQQNDSALTKVQDKYAALEGLEADIVQEVFQSALNKFKSSKGTLLLKKPNFIRWEIAEPEMSVLVSNGKKLFYYTPAIDPKGKGQVVEKSAKDILKQPVYKILLGQSKFANEFEIIKESKDEQSTLVELKPKEGLSDIKQIKLTINKANEITEILLSHANENTTKILLQNTKLGGKLPLNLFDFKIPPNTNLVKE